MNKQILQVVLFVVPNNLANYCILKTVPDLTMYVKNALDCKLGFSFLDGRTNCPNPHKDERRP